jgi:hypothetical protein
MPDPSSLREVRWLQTELSRLLATFPLQSSPSRLQVCRAVLVSLVAGAVLSGAVAMLVLQLLRASQTAPTTPAAALKEVTL